MNNIGKRKIQEEKCPKSKKAKEVRVWVDGCFDMIHYGHADALRQAKQMGDRVVVGVYHDEEIMKHKGPPVFDIDKRCKILEGIKWVDEVVKGVPFVTTVETVDAYNCDFAAHGDDYTTTVDGKDSFYDVKAVGRFKEYKRSLVISTTDLIARMLSATKTHHQSDNEPHLERTEAKQFSQNGAENNWPTGTGSSEYVTSSRKIIQFSEGKEPKLTDRVVYVAGAFDLFHIGHLEFLKKAAAEGDYLIVGIHKDSDVNKYHGSNYPIMNLHERVLRVLANKYVSEVLIGAPIEVTAHILDHYKINVVCQGRTPVQVDFLDPYAEPKKRNVFKQIDSGSNVTTKDIVNKIRQNRSAYEVRNEKKLAREAKYLPTAVNVCNDKLSIT